MVRFFWLFGMSIASIGILGQIGTADAVSAVGRGAPQGVRSAGAMAARMPSMPAMSIISIGNISTDIPETPVKPDVPVEPEQPDTPVEPDVPVEPDAPIVSECEDGGVKNSDYTVSMCMDDILRCVNSGGFSNGLNELFNVGVMNDVIAGKSNACQNQIQKCVSDVRTDCANVYANSGAVWTDFDTRVVKPEYYNFVLRKTGLSPAQAEGTCAVLAGTDADKKAYWDSMSATCYVRVAAYNKGSQITNTWLFGAAGNDEPAQVWRATGDVFTCNKDLFGFSLMNKTRTAAVVGVGGGAVLGTGIGAIAGHGARDFDCSNSKHLKELTESLQRSGKFGVLNQYLMPNMLSTTDLITTAQCQEIINLYNKYTEYMVAIDECAAAGYDSVDLSIKMKVTINDKTVVDVPVKDGKIVGDINAILKQSGHAAISQEEINRITQNVESQIREKMKLRTEDTCKFKPFNQAKVSGAGIYCNAVTGCVSVSEARTEVQTLGDVFAGIEILNGEESNMGKAIGIGAASGVGAGAIATAITALVEHNNISCVVGNDLGQVGLKKSYSIDGLKALYTKLGLNIQE